MLADTIDLQIRAVEEESLLGIELDIAETSGCRDGIHGFLAHQKFSLHRVEARVGDTPQRGILHLERLLRLVACGRGYHLSLGIIHRVAELGLACLALPVNTYLYLTIGGGGDILPPLVDVYIRGFSKPNMAIDAATAVPTAVGLVAVVHFDSDHIVTFFIYIRCKVVFETAISIGAGAELMAVDIDRGVHVDTIEANDIAVELLLGVDGEMLAIPAHSSGQGTTAGTRGITWQEVALDRPVVGQVERSPSLVGIG